MLTGPPSCGKTTAVLRLVERLADLRVAFQAVGVSTDQRAVLAHVRSRSRLHVGRYGVEPATLTQLAAAELSRPPGEVDIFVVDEIGKMELLCPVLVDAVRRRLDGPVPVVAMVAMKGGGADRGGQRRRVS